MRDCTAWISSADDPARRAECGLMATHNRHVGPNADGDLITWLDDDEGAGRG